MVFREKKLSEEDARERRHYARDQVKQTKHKQENLFVSLLLNVSASCRPEPDF